jgi:hypothetical protein
MIAPTFLPSSRTFSAHGGSILSLETSPP